MPIAADVRSARRKCGRRDTGRQVLRTRRSKLKAGTDELHRLAEARLAQAAPLAHEAGYARFLLCMIDLYEHYARGLDQASRLAGLPACSATIIGALSRDLGDLGGRYAARPPLVLTTDDQAWGIGYALEGSALGAQIITKTVTSALGSSTPQRFLNAVAAAGKGRWPPFVAAVNASAGDDAITVEAARGVFETLIDTIDKYSADSGDLDGS